MAVHGHEKRAYEDQELFVLGRRSPRLKKVLSVIGRKRPVIMFSGAVNARERFFMEEAHEIMTQRHFLHGLHHELVMVRRNVGRGKDRRHFILGRRYLIVFGLRGDPHLPKLDVEVSHEISNTVFDRTEILILKFLPFGGRRAEESPSRNDQINTLFIVVLVDQKVFLFRTDG